ncbi:MAG: putative lipid II flippase FtsW [Christensenellaceae bacterium]|jgi:cell division protein FtsW|nr:putative lipid II flippase FtsW [Christensenellaceae bacterium]
MDLKRNILVSTLILCGIGIVMIYSASSYVGSVKYGDSLFYVKKQGLALLLGLVCMYLASRMDITKIERFGLPIYIVGLVLLLIIFIPGVGSNAYGATRWIDLRVITFQPSEIAKFTLVVFLAKLFSKKHPTTIASMIIPILVVACMLVAVLLEPNMSCAICMAAISMIMFIVGGIRFRHAVAFASLGIGGGIALIFAEPYRIKRLMAYLDPWSSPRGEGYQLIQSYYALGSGGLFGVGLFASRQKYLYLPFSESDFIFSIIGEELGVIGCVVVLLIFSVYIASGIAIAIKSDERFKSLLALGIVSVVSVQTILNVAVVTGSIPPTGLPLPFISAGGSSLIVFLIATGVLISIDTEKIKQAKRNWVRMTS